MMIVHQFAGTCPAWCRRIEVISGQPGGAQLVLPPRPAMLQSRLVQTIPVYTLLSPLRQAGWQILGITMLGLILLGCAGVPVCKADHPTFATINQANKTTGERGFRLPDLHLRRNMPIWLIGFFNHMASQLTTLMEQVKDGPGQTVKPRTGLLEAQIKPHFLYDTLDMIHWRPLHYEAKDISHMIVQLSKLLRIGLSGGTVYTGS